MLNATPLKGPCPLVLITPIAEPGHPACGQHGLAAARALQEGEMVITYVGEYLPDSVQPGKDQDYCLRLCPGLSMDAAHVGNEARFINAHRGVKIGGSLPRPTSSLISMWTRARARRTWACLR